MELELAAEFTECSTAHQDTHCDSCHAVVLTGEKRWLVVSARTSEHRWCCRTCYIKYSKREGTVIRRTSTHSQSQRRQSGAIPPGPSAQRPVPVPPDIMSIRAMTNQAQRDGSSRQYVVPLPRPHLSGAPMGPPPVPFRQAQLPAVSVSVLGTPVWSGPSHNPHYTPTPTPDPAHRPPTSFGYTGAHLFWPAARDAGARAAYRQVTETLSIRGQLMHEVAGKTSAKLIGNISEGIGDVPADVTPPMIRTLLINHLAPRLQAELPLDHYDIKWDKMVLREFSNWVDMSAVDPERAYLYKRYQKGKKGSTDLQFKAPQSPPVFALVISVSDWADIQLYIAEQDLAKAKASKVSSRFDSVFDTVAIQKAANPGGLAVRPEITYNHPDQDYPVSVDSLESTMPPLRLSGTQGHPIVSRPVTPPPSSSKRPFVESPNAIIETTKRPHPAPFVSPNQREIQAAMIAHQTPDNFSALTTTSESIHFFPIPSIEFHSLLKSAELYKLRFNDNPIHGHLITRTNDEVGSPGTFKTAYFGTLTLQNANTAIELGRSANTTVAVKRFYHFGGFRKKDQTPIISRYKLHEELTKVAAEGNTLYWATSLFQLAYQFIDYRLSIASKPPSFEVPRVRFVHAGVVHTYENRAARTAYLVEELITGTFRKFINNAHAFPLVEDDHADYDFAQFLCFVQHVQWEKTRGMAFVSDLQGSNTLLTDPQIITHPSYSDAFALGNVPEAYNRFISEHLCNHFCSWFGLQQPTIYSPEALAKAVATLAKDVKPGSLE